MVGKPESLIPVLTSPEGEECPPLHHARVYRVMQEYHRLCDIAETVFPIVSGYRSFAWQYKYFSFGRNTHCKGYSLDIAPVDDWTVGRMSAVAQYVWMEETSQLRGIGIYPRWLHIDVRPRQRRALWVGSSSLLD